MEVVDSQQLRRCRFFVTVRIYPCMSPADTLHNSSEDVDRGGGGPWRWWTVEVVKLHSFNRLATAQKM